MVWITRSWFVLAVLLFGCTADRVHDGVVTRPVTTLADVPVPVHTESTREAVVRIARAEVGTMEVGCNNCGPGPKKYLASVGFKEGAPYCAAGQYWCLEKAGIAPPGGKSQYARAAVWHQTSRRLPIADSALAADFAGYYYKALGRIGHTELIVSQTAKQVRVIGFNTTNGISRDGQGVFEKVILRSQVTVTSRWIE